MNTPSDPDLVKVTEIFLVPSSFLVAALGTADTNFHRGMVSLLGLIISILWWVCSRDAIFHHPTPAPHNQRLHILSRLPVLFLLGWLLSTVAHLALWNRPLGS